MAVIAAGVRFYQNYQAIQRVQEKTEAVSSSAVGEENIEKSVLEDARKTNKGIEAMPKEEAEKIIKKEEKIEEHIEKQKEDVYKRQELHMLVAEDHQQTNLVNITVDQAIRENIHMDVVIEEEPEKPET